MPSTASVRAAVNTTRIIPNLCQIPPLAAALDQRPPLQAAAVPDSQSSTIHIAHAAVSQPSQPNAAVNAPQTAATAALTNKNTLLF